jgi:hypothetical protein
MNLKYLEKKLSMIILKYNDMFCPKEWEKLREILG